MTASLDALPEQLALSGTPPRWPWVRAKYLFRRQQRAVRKFDDIVTAFRDGTVTLRRNRREDGFTFAEKEIGYQGVRKGDLVVHAMDGFAGAIGVSDSDGKASPVCSVCSSVGPDIIPQFYSALLRHLALSGFISSLARGIRERSTDFRYGEFKELSLPVPPPEEQRRIASFLNRKTAAIDELIRKKERLIELLQEKRQALITQAVTKGLDPNVPMKESAIPSIGRVPSHWLVTQLKRRWRVIDCKHRTATYIPDGYALVSTTEVKAGRLDLSGVERRVGESDFRDLTEGRLPRRGDIIFSRNASLGAAAYVDTVEPFCMGQDVVLITSCQESQLYLSYVLNSSVAATQVEQVCIGSTFKRINVPDIERIAVPIPPPEEQRAIAATLDASVETLDSVCSVTQASLGRLREYRQALISAAVTGQLDLSKEAVQ